jgi:predicted RNase H-like HicB family nuclease
MKTFTMDYWKDGDVFVGRLREIPAVLSQGATVDGLTKHIADAYKLFHGAQGAALPDRKFQSVEVTI